MQMQISDVGGVTKAALFGRLDSRSVRDDDQGEAYFFAHIPKEQPAVVDMSDVSFIASLGVRMLIDTARALEGLRREDSVHAAGVVIADAPLVNYLPLKLAKDSRDDSRRIVTQFDMHGVEKLGLLKMSLWGNTNGASAAEINVKESSGKEKEEGALRHVHREATGSGF